MLEAWRTRADDLVDRMQCAETEAERREIERQLLGQLQRGVELGHVRPGQLRSAVARARRSSRQEIGREPDRACSECGKKMRRRKGFWHCQRTRGGCGRRDAR